MQTSGQLETAAVRAIDDSIRESTERRRAADQLRQRRALLFNAGRACALLIALVTVVAAFWREQYALGTGVVVMTVLMFLIFGNVVRPGEPNGGGDFDYVD